MGGVATAQRRVKDLVRRAAERNPRLIKDNSVYHGLQRYRAYREIETRPDLTSRRDLLDPLVEDGIVVVEDYFSAERIGEMRVACEAVLDRVDCGELGEQTWTVQPDILVRLAEVDELVPETQAFFGDPGIHSVMAAAMSPRVVSFRKELEHRFGVGKTAQADLYHFDNWRPICKAFLLLDDVGPDNAPFVYVPGTHRPAAWKRRHERDFDTLGPRGPFGHFFPQEIRYLRDEIPWRERVCTGKAGTLILADFRGLHRGTPLRSGRRILLNNTFDLMNAGPG